MIYFLLMDNTMVFWLKIFLRPFLFLLDRPKIFTKNQKKGDIENSLGDNSPTNSYQKKKIKNKRKKRKMGLGGFFYL